MLYSSSVSFYVALFWFNILSLDLIWSKILLFTSAIFSSLWHKTDISAQIILGLGCVILKAGACKSKNSETKESGFLAGNPEAYKKFNLKLKKHFKIKLAEKEHT